MAVQLIVTTASASDINVEVVPVANQSIIIDRGIAGPVGMTWRGDWSSATAYSGNDAVYYAASNASYICILSNTNQVPTNTTYWQLLVSGAGNVTGAISSTDNAIARFDGTTGKAIQNSAVYIDDSGNLGIGTTSPGAALHIVNAGEATLKISSSSAGSARLYMDGNGGGAAGITSSANGMYLTNTDASPFVFSVNGAEKMRLNASGNFGIGTSSPAYKLDVAGTIGVTGSAATILNSFYSSGTTTAANYGAITNTGNTLLWGVDSSTGGAISGGTAYSTFVGSNSAYPLHLITGGAVKVTLDASGNLYIANGKIGPNATQQHTMPAVASDTYTLNAATQTLTNKTLTDPTIIGTITEDVFTITDGASVVIDPTNGSIQLWTLGASRTPTTANFGAGESITFMINDGTAYAITWTSVPVTWVGGTAPTLATTGYTVIELWKVASTIYGSRVGQVA